jgi:hypothetical protein
MLWMCSMAVACEPDEALDETEIMAGSGGRSDANAAVNTSDATGATTPRDAEITAPGNVVGGGNGGSGSSSGGGSGGGGNTGGADASASTSDLDAGASQGNRDAGGTGGVVIGPSMRRDGGPARWDPDAAGPVLKPEVQAACTTLVQNICTRVTECEIMLAGLSESRRAQVFESCRSSFLRAHNCNRAVATASGFTACTEETKTRDCIAVFATEYGSSCADQITFQP